MGCVPCKEKGAGKGQAEGEGGSPQPPTSQYDPDTTQPGAIFTRIPDFNNFQGPAVPLAPSFAEPGGFTSNVLQTWSGGITGQQGAWMMGRGAHLHPWAVHSGVTVVVLCVVPSVCHRWGGDTLHRPVRL